MPVTLSELQRNTRTVPCEYNGLTINLTYRPAVITPGVTASREPVAELLMQALVAWDIYEDDDMQTMLPITLETLNGPNIGSLLLKALLQAIFLDTLTGKVSGATSAAG